LEIFVRTGWWSVFGRSGTSSDKNLQIVAGGQYLVEVEQALTKIFKLQQFGDFCQSLFYFY
jgi:hypothetical protein